MKKRALLVLMVLAVVLAFTSVTASATVTKSYTIKIYRDTGSVPSYFSNYSLKWYVNKAMQKIQEAVDNGSGGSVALEYTILGPYNFNGPWDYYGCGFVQADNAQNFAVYFTYNVAQESGWGSAGGSAVVDLWPNSSCPNYQGYRPKNYVATTHELGHVFGAGAHCNDSALCTMDANEPTNDVKNGVYDFCDYHEGKIADWVEDH